VGTLRYEKGPFAFFDGSDSEFRQVVQPEGRIAGYQVVEISGQAVTLRLGTNQIQLKVGMQMRREEGGSWELAGSGEAFAATSSSSAPSSGSSSSGASGSASSSSGGDASEILKRLMQKREEESK
jgi:hypothetical protein